MYALTSEDLQPKLNEISSRFYYLKVSKNEYGTQYPASPRTHKKHYQIRCEHTENLITFWGVETEYLHQRDAIENFINQQQKGNKLTGFKVFLALFFNF
jgi:hypothetical protein